MSFGRSLSASLLASLLVSGCAPPQVRKVYPASDLPEFRAPAVPLVVQTPYLNVWLFGDRLTDDSPKLWNGQVKGMAGLVRVDGKAYRFLGMPGSSIPAMRQERVRVWPTRTEFEFSIEDVRLKLEFLSPLDPRDLQALSLPLAFIRAELSSRTGRNVWLYLDVTGEWAVGSSDRRMTFDGRFRLRPSQPRLFRETSNYADWGEIHWIAVDPALSPHGPDAEVRQAFIDGASPRRDVRYPRAANDEWPVFAHTWDLGLVKEPVARRALLAHVRREAALFLGEPCLSYWTKAHADGAAMVARAAATCDEIRTRALELDAEVLARSREAGGDPLAALAALSFRQAFAANELVLHQGKPLYFSKSLDISGASPVQNVETLAAAAPALLAFNPKLLALQVLPILETLRRGEWRERHAPRDLGLYPNATGQAQPEENRVEATASLLLLVAMARLTEPRALDDFEPVVHGLSQFLLDAAAPEIWGTGDTGPILSSILALAASRDGAAAAVSRMKRWLSEADGGDHTTIAFGDKTGWSLKRQMLSDRLLGIRLVPDDAVAREIAFALARSGKYGAPLDSRRAHTSVEALFALASLASQKDRELFVAGVLRAINESPTRLPAGDRYESDTARIAGGQARSTLGCVFAPLLLHERSAPR
jgi:hypothetical protein